MIKKKLPNQSNAFQTAVESVHDLVSAYRKGLKALDNAAASCMVVNNSRLVDGSVDIDTTLKRKYPKANRWDYVFSYNGKAYYVEVHPATDGQVKVMMAKKKWLIDWLQIEAQSLDAYPSASPRLYWIQSGRNGLTKGSIEYRRAAQTGLLPQPKLCLV